MWARLGPIFIYLGHIWGWLLAPVVLFGLWYYGRSLFQNGLHYFRAHLGLFGSHVYLFGAPLRVAVSPTVWLESKHNRQP